MWLGIGVSLWHATSTGLVSGPDVTAPFAIGFSPSDDAIDISITTDLVATISEGVVLNTGLVTLKKTSDNSTIQSWNVATQAGTGAGQVSVVSGNQLTMRLTSPLLNVTGYYVIWDAGVVKDAANNLIAAQASTSLWSFTTLAGAVGGTGLLDLYPTASMAYSFRKLRAAYAGSAVRIRRSSDNAEANIGFLANGDFDSAAAAAHIGGGSGFIVTWFDQSGNGIDVTQATAASQPTYSATGINGKPTTSCDGTDDGLSKASVANTSLPLDTTTIMSVMLDQRVNASQSLFAWEVTSPTNRFLTLSPYNNTVIYFDDGNNTSGSVAAGVTSTELSSGTGHLLEMGREDVGDFQFITVDGVEKIRTGGKTSLPTAGTASFSIGNYSGYPFKGLVSELVIWAADLAANRTAARSNVGTYWGTPGFAAFTPLLDALGVSATRAYSTRKLRSAYSGSAIRIRRSSDNAEQDIGFVGENLDVSAVSTFVGANSAFVVKWYDQSGSADDLAQTTVAEQARIVSAGTLDVRNGKAAPLFDGVDDKYPSSAAFTRSSYGTVIAINSAGPNFGNFWCVASSQASGSLLAGSSGTGIFFGANQNVNNVAGGVAVFGGVLQHVNANPAAAAQTGGWQYIGSDNLIAGRFWLGWIGEFVVFPSVLSAGNQTAMFTNQAAYWGTPYLLLDQLGATATRAYSTRKLRAAYAGIAIRIRRSSDNAEQDIGFSGEDLNTAAVATFVGANSAFVVKWYDQSGSAVDLNQTTAASQPRIVNAGTLEVRNTKASPYFDGTDDKLPSAAVAWTCKTAGVVVAADMPGPAFNQYVGVLSSVANNYPIVGTNGVSAWDTGQLGVLNVNNTGASNVVFGGLAQNVRGSHATGFAATEITMVGNDRNLASYWKGWIGEVVSFDTQLSAPNYATLYTNQKTYWGTP